MFHHLHTFIDAVRIPPVRLVGVIVFVFAKEFR